MKRKARRPRVCIECGRRIVARRPHKVGMVYRPRGYDHALCQRCWKSEQDRSRLLICR
jgi:hypothetical protein